MKKEYGFKGLNNKINEHFQLIVEKKIRKNLIKKVNRFQTSVIIFIAQGRNHKTPNNASLTAIEKELTILIVPEDISLNAYQNLIICMM